MIGQELSFVSITSSFLQISLPDDQALEPLEIVLETVNTLTSKVYFRDLVNVQVIANSNTDLLNDILEVTVLAPFLEPKPQTEMIAYVGAALSIYIGQPSSKYQNDVQTEV